MILDQCKKDSMGIPDSLAGKESAWNAGGPRRHGFNSWVGKIPWRRKWQPTPVFLPEKSHGLGILVSYNLKGHKESDTAERLNMQAKHRKTACWFIADIKPSPFHCPCFRKCILLLRVFRDFTGKKGQCSWIVRIYLEIMPHKNKSFIPIFLFLSKE